MALKDEINKEPENTDTSKLSDAEEKDLSIMVNLAKNMIDDDGINVIKSAENSKDQGQVIGQFLFQLGSALAEKLSGMVDISPRIMLAEGGWVEQVSDYLQEEYGVPKDIMDRAEIYIGGTAQSVGLAELEKQQGGAPQGAVPPAGPEQMPPTLPQPGGMV